MAVIDYAPRALADLERVGDFLSSDDPGAASRTAELVTHAVELLKVHPLIGRPAEAGSRELVISRGRSGYLALYDYDEAADRVTILGIRHQREAGYKGP